MNWQAENLLEAAHNLGRVVTDFRSIPGAARQEGSVAWEHLMWSIGDFERRYRDLFGEPPPDVGQYRGVQLEDGTVILQGERGVILAELVARTISIPDTDILVLEIPGNVPNEAKQTIAKQIRQLLGNVHEQKPVIVLANGQRLHGLTVEHMTNMVREIGTTANAGTGATEEPEKSAETSAP